MDEEEQDQHRGQNTTTTEILAAANQYRAECERLKAELAQAKAENARLAAAITTACDQLKRGEWSSHSSGTWVILNDAIHGYRTAVEGGGAL